jgi:hypothetical protein
LRSLLSWVQGSPRGQPVSLRCLLGYCVQGGGISYASHRGEAWPEGHPRSAETRLRAACRRWCSCPEPSCVACERPAGARGPWAGTPGSHAARQGHVMALSWYQQSPEGRATPRLSHKKFTRLSNASNLLGQSAKSSSAARKFVTLHWRNKRRAQLHKEPIIWA